MTDRDVTIIVEFSTALGRNPLKAALSALELFEERAAKQSSLGGKK